MKRRKRKKRRRKSEQKVKVEEEEEKEEEGEEEEEEKKKSWSLRNDRQRCSLTCTFMHTCTHAPVHTCVYLTHTNNSNKTNLHNNVNVFYYLT